MAAVSAFTTPGAGVHPPTLIAACARMAGTYLFRSFGLRIPEGAAPGQVVLSEEASKQIPALLQTCAGVLARLGTTIASAPSGPIVEEKSKPRQELLDTQKRLEPLFAPLQLKYVLDNRQAAHAAAVATAMAVHASRQHLDPNAGFGLAAFSFAEGSQTLPAEIGKAGNAA